MLVAIIYGFERGKQMRQRFFSVGTAFLLLCLTTGCSFTENKQEIPSPVMHHPLQQSVEQKKTVSALQDKTVTIATGDISGVYFPLGKALAGIYEQYGGAVTGTRITKASIENIKLVAQKKAELGFATVDALPAASHTNNNKQSGLRAITGLYFNYIHIAATKKSGIHSLEDLNGKRIGMGPIGSGTELTAERILQAAHLTRYAMKKYYFSFSQSAEALRHGDIDAAFFSSGLPNPDIRALTKEMSLVLVPVPKSVMSTLQQQYPYYSMKAIPKETYRGLHNDIETVAIKNVLLTYSDLPEETAYELVKNLYTHLPELSSIHPAAQEIRTKDANENIYLPLHPGAARYFEENK
jgi:TRAP transporter TAXI family solute receptor